MDVDECDHPCELVEEYVNSCDSAYRTSLVEAYSRYKFEETGTKIEVTFSPFQSTTCFSENL